MSLMLDAVEELKRDRNDLSQLRANIADYRGKAQLLEDALTGVIQAIDLQLEKLKGSEAPAAQASQKPTQPTGVDPKRRAAALKAWDTIRKKYPQGSLAKKAWETMRDKGLKPPVKIKVSSAANGPPMCGERNGALMARIRKKVQELGIDSQAIDWSLTYHEIIHQLDELTGKVIPKFAILQSGGM